MINVDCIGVSHLPTQRFLSICNELLEAIEQPLLDVDAGHSSYSAIVAPASARTDAMASPIPPLPPVTMATFPVSAPTLRFQIPDMLASMIGAK